MDIALKILLFFLCCGISGWIWSIREKVLEILDTVCAVIDLVLEPLSRPIKRLYFAVKEKIVDWTAHWFYDLPITRFAERYHVFGTAVAIRLLLLSLLYLIVMLIISACTTGLGVFIEELFYILPLGFIIQWGMQGFSLDLVGLISAGFTGFLSLMMFKKCMETYYYETGIVRLLVKILYYIVLTCTACSISLHLNDFWELLATGGITLFENMKAAFDAAQWTFLGVLQMIGSGLLVLVLLYFGIILLIVAVKEYVDIIGHSILGFLLLAAILVFCYVLLPESFMDSEAGNTVVFLILFGTMFYSDYMRVESEIED